MLNRLRQLTPLLLRQKIGPYIGYLHYWLRTRVKGRTWEPNVLSPTETLKLISENNLSLIRFGDGELSLIEGTDLAFQKHDPDLAQKLKEVLTSDKKGLLIGVPGIFGRLEHFSKLGFWFEIHHLFRYHHLWKQLTKPEKIYGDAFITRPYLSYRDKTGAEGIYQQIKALWQGKDVLLIEGEKSRLGVGNDLFQNANSVKRILGPAENAFTKSDDLINTASKYSKDHLVILSLGPAAKVIGYELFTQGYQVIDIGHLDMEYEMFLRGSDKLVPVRYKYFNEIDERQPENCNDLSYRSEIVATIV